MDIDNARRIAGELAKANVETEASISEVFWVPNSDRLYLIEVDETSIPSGDYVRPMYFGPESEIPLPSGIAMVTREEFGKLKLPAGWGTWDALEHIWPPKAEGNGGA